MKNKLLAALLSAFFCLHATAQGTCADMAMKEKTMTEAANKFLTIATPSPAEIKDFSVKCGYYKTYFFEVFKRTYYVQKSIASVMALKAALAEMYLYQKQGNDEAVLASAVLAFDTYFDNIDPADNYNLICHEGTITIRIQKQEYQIAATDFLSVAIKTALKLNKEELAVKFFTLGVENDSFNRTWKVNEMAGLLMDYRLQKNALDDVTFWAAYEYLNSTLAPKSLVLAIKEFGKEHDGQALTVITDPKFIKRKLVRTKAAGYFHYNSYYQDLYTYLTTDTFPNGAHLRHGVLKSLIKSYYANGEKGFWPNILTKDLQSANIFNTVVQSGDRELMELLADFIRKVYDDKAPSEVSYGAYLCYHALGDERQADKMYKRIDKSFYEKYKKI